MKRSKHSLTHYKLLTMKMGMLVPVSWFEVLPGDTIQMSTSALVRAAPMVTPAMHPCHIRLHHFFVPNRIIWANWTKFITGGQDGMDATVHPTNNALAGTHAQQGQLADYLGVPTSGTAVGNLNALPWRAYASIWNEYYRDQDLEAAVALSTGDGPDGTTYGCTGNVACLNCDWEKDYLTSARPWEVKGPSVTIPLGTTAPILGIGITGTPGPDQNVAVRETAPEPNRTYTHGVATNAAGPIIETDSAPGASTKPKIFADLSNASAVTINTLRHALAVQRFEEARARYGSRYTEYLRYLGVRSSDQRLQRPEYLGGGRSTLQISEVLQTGVTTSGSNAGVATMFGHGISAMRSNRFRRFFEEHGIVMTLMSVRPRTMYSQAVHRKLMRGCSGYADTALSIKEGYWQRELQHIGQQKVDAQEVDGVQNTAGVVFGYQDRYDEYRRQESTVAGQFRSSLDTWHLSREFAAPAALNASFVSCVPATRIFADTSNDNLYVMAHHSIQARRLVSREGNSLTF